MSDPIRTGGTPANYPPPQTFEDRLCSFQAALWRVQDSYRRACDGFGDAVGNYWNFDYVDAQLGRMQAAVLAAQTDLRLMTTLMKEEPTHDSRVNELDGVFVFGRNAERPASPGGDA